MNEAMNEKNLANQRYWDAAAADWEQLRDQDQMWRRCAQRPELAFDGESLAMIQLYTGNLHGKRACVLGSGDNYAAFALVGMGAQVTSTDISEQQLAVAQKRAAKLELEITFRRADATSLNDMADMKGEFDLVCSSNGFYVWIAEPKRIFQQVYRLLKPGGFYIFYDVHSFQRPWKDQVAPLEMEQPYTATGPFKEEEYGQANYQFHWRISDLLNPLIDAGLVLRQMAESSPKDARFWTGISYLPGSDESLLDWRNNPRAGLPVWLTVAAQKPPG